MTDPPRMLDPEEVIRASFTALNDRDWQADRDLLDDACEWTAVARESTDIGPNAIQAGAREFVAAFPDLVVRIVSIVAIGPMVAVEWEAAGTNLGPFAGGAPTGRSFRRRGASVAEVRDGRIVAYRDYFDRLSLLSQIGRLDLLPREPT
jgi:ketosteroid isomerase-like protein